MKLDQSLSAEEREAMITEVLDEIFYPFYKLAAQWGAGHALTDRLDSVRADCETDLYCDTLRGAHVARRLHQALDRWLEVQFGCAWDKAEHADYWDVLINPELYPE